MALLHLLCLPQPRPSPQADSRQGVRLQLWQLQVQPPVPAWSRHPLPLQSRLGAVAPHQERSLPQGTPRLPRHRWGRNNRPPTFPPEPGCTRPRPFPKPRCHHPLHPLQVRLQGGRVLLQQECHLSHAADPGPHPAASKAPLALALLRVLLRAPPPPPLLLPPLPLHPCCEEQQPRRQCLQRGCHESGHRIHLQVPPPPRLPMDPRQKQHRNCVLETGLRSVRTAHRRLPLRPAKMVSELLPPLAPGLTAPRAPPS
mmetsp:Transcript_117/g.278  ORF Transcript_117/g.278 Transcript_117/m.278 type:complete len:256 (+) Transcript_117:1423-2190(+)